MQIFCSQNVSQSSLSQESEQNISIKNKKESRTLSNFKEEKSLQSVYYTQYPSTSNRASDNE